jgi:urease accessory protein
LGVAGIPVPGVEIGIAGSAIVLGLLIVTKARPPLWVAGLIVAVFGVFHGHAHGTELPEATNPAAYAIGFVLATGLLHLAGIVLGLALRWPFGSHVVRAGGVVIALVGAAFLVGAA